MDSIHADMMDADMTDARETVSLGIIYNNDLAKVDASVRRMNTTLGELLTAPRKNSQYQQPIPIVEKSNSTNRVLKEKNTYGLQHSSEREVSLSRKLVVAELPYSRSFSDNSLSSSSLTHQGVHGPTLAMEPNDNPRAKPKQASFKITRVKIGKVLLRLPPNMSQSPPLAPNFSRNTLARKKAHSARTPDSQQQRQNQPFISPENASNTPQLRTVNSDRESKSRSQDVIVCN